jgi:hypothetical protein
MNAINSAYPIIDAQSSQASAEIIVKQSLWQRVLNMLSQAGHAALIVG